MFNKKERTIDHYMKLGAEARLLKTLGSKFWADIATVIPKHDLHRLDRALEIIKDVCCKADGRMFADHPELDNAFTKVFFGATDSKPRDDLEQSLLAIASEVADKLVYTTPEADNDRS